jgi:hypothetical protein
MSVKRREKYKTAFGVPDLGQSEVFNGANPDELWKEQPLKKYSRRHNTAGM